MQWHRLNRQQHNSVNGLAECLVRIEVSVLNDPEHIGEVKEGVVERPACCCCCWCCSCNLNYC